MDQAVQRDVRSAITLAYGLSRHTHVQQREAMAIVLRQLEEELRRIEADLGGPRRDEIGDVDFGPVLAEVEAMIDPEDPVLGAQIEALIQSVRSLQQRLSGRSSSEGIPSRPLLGVLPVARVIPQDVHAALDYASGVTVAAAGLFAESVEARAASAMLGASGIGASAATDYRLSLVKLIPIEAHEAIDYVWGATAIAAPFVLGYYKKDPIAAAVHVATGALTILASLFTDYRAAVGVGHKDEA